MFFEIAKVAPFRPGTIDPVGCVFLTDVVLVLSGVEKLVEGYKILLEEKVANLNPATFFISDILPLVPGRALFKLIDDPNANNGTDRHK